MVIESRLPDTKGWEFMPDGDISVSSETVSVLDSLLSAYGSVEDAYDSLGDERLRGLIETADPTLFNLLKQGREKLDGEPGYFVLKSTGLERLSYPLAQFTAIALSSFFGRPTKPSPRSRIVAWPIDYTQETGTPGVTFSETNAEASLHTDAQYSAEPEAYFGLFCIKPASDGGGISRIVNCRAVLDNVAEVDGLDTLAELAKPFPFRVPNIFMKDPSSQAPEITWAPIVSPKGIRYRKDTLEGALSVEGVTIAPDQLRALEAFEEALVRAPLVTYSLEAGDVIFVNNCKVLHGRSSFEDPERLMLRVRVK